MHVVIANWFNKWIIIISLFLLVCIVHLLISYDIMWNWRLISSSHFEHIIKILNFHIYLFSISTYLSELFFLLIIIKSYEVNKNLYK